MTLLKWILMAVLAVVIATMLADFFPGQVIVLAGGWSMETSLLLWILLVIGFYAVVNVSVWAWRWPARKARQFSEKRAQAQLELGLLALAEGDFRKAEKALKLSSQGTNAPAASLLAAAQAAQAGGQEDRSDEYLARAEERGDGHRSIPITKAQVALARGDAAAARELLESIPRYRTRPRALELLIEAYRALGRWQELAALAPDLIKTGVIGKEEADALKRTAQQRSLVAAADAEDLAQRWNSLSRADQNESAFVAAYARRAIALDLQTRAADALRKALSAMFDEELARLLAGLEPVEPAAELKNAQAWLERTPDSPGLNWYVGKLCRACQLWGKAREHLERGAEGGSIGAMGELAGLHEDLGETEQALATYRRAVIHSQTTR